MTVLNSSRAHRWPHRETHLRNLETLGLLFGLHPAPLEKCRVLELYSGAGENLLPQLGDFPGSQFIAVDPSAELMDRARALASELKYQHVQFREAEIKNIDENWGQFDYIFCHGGFSRVSDSAREAMFDVCRRQLAPQGVALFSFAANPGWGLRQQIHEMLRYHISPLADIRQKASHARAMLGTMARLSDEKTAYGQLLREEAEGLKNLSDAYIYHELLAEPVVRPLFFNQFIEQARRYKLQFLSESNVARMLPSNLPEEHQKALKGLDLMRQEQYLDFLRGNAYRITLLCAENIPLKRHLKGEAMKPFCIGLAAPLEKTEETGDSATYKVRQGTMTVRAPIVKAALEYLAEAFPREVSFNELYTASLAKIGVKPRKAGEEASEDALGQALLSAWGANLLQVARTPPRFAGAVGKTPTACPLARLQAARGIPVTNRRHETVDLDGLSRFLLPKVDGNRDQQALIAEMEKGIAEGVITARQDDKKIDHVDTKALQELVSRMMQTFSQAALLVECS